MHILTQLLKKYNHYNNTIIDEINITLVGIDNIFYNGYLFITSIPDKLEIEHTICLPIIRNQKFKHFASCNIKFRKRILPRHLLIAVWNNINQKWSISLDDESIILKNTETLLEEK